MITASFTFTPDDTITKVEVSGHAEAASFGYDIVCASVSSLVIAAINGLEEYVQINSYAKVENGSTTFEIKTENETEAIQAQAIAHTFYLAMVGLEEEYDDYIEIKITEE